MKKLLVPTDFSDYAREALIYAIELCKELGGGEIVFMNAYPLTSISPYVYDQLIDSIRKDISENTINKLKDVWHKSSKGLLKGNKIKGNKISVKFVGKEGTIVDNIVETAKKEKVDLIVMGTKGAGKIKRILFGSTASKVIAKAHCPVLAIPKFARYKKLNNILYVTECKRHELHNIADLCKIAEIYNSSVHIVYITDKFKTIGKKDLETFKEEVLKTTKIRKLHFEYIRSNDIEGAVEVYIQLKKVSLIALTTKRSSLFKKIFNKGLARELAFHTKIPLLAYHR